MCHFSEHHGPANLFPWHDCSGRRPLHRSFSIKYGPSFTKIFSSGQGYVQEQQTLIVKDMTVILSSSWLYNHYICTEKLYTVSAAMPLHLTGDLCYSGTAELQWDCGKWDLCNRCGNWWFIFYPTELAGTQVNGMLTGPADSRRDDLPQSPMWWIKGVQSLDLFHGLRTSGLWVRRRSLKDELKNETTSDCPHCHCCLFCSEYLLYPCLHEDLHAMSVCPGLPLFRWHEGTVLWTGKMREKHWRHALCAERIKWDKLKRM